MYTTIIHPLRRAFILSLNEYVLIDTIYHLSHNERYNSWCVASKKYLAKTLDLSERWIYSAIQKLIIKELIIKDEATNFLKTTDVWNEMIANKNDWLLGFTGKESQFISAKVAQEKLKDGMQNLQGVCKKFIPSMQNLQGEYAKSAYNNNINNNINNNLSSIIIEDREINISQNPVRKEINIFNKKLITSLSAKTIINSKVMATEQEKCSYGNQQINEFLAWYKTVCKDLGVTFEDFYRSGMNNERNFAKHFLNYRIKHQLDNEALKERLTEVFNDKWVLGKASNLKIVYNALKSLPKISEEAKRKQNKLVYITL